MKKALIRTYRNVTYKLQSACIGTSGDLSMDTLSKWVFGALALFIVYNAVKTAFPNFFDGIIQKFNDLLNLSSVA